MLSKEKPQQDEKLFFVNAGGYSADIFGEGHEIGYCVAQNAMEATKKTLPTLCVGQDKMYRDDIHDVDECLAIEKVQDYYLHLILTNKTQDFKPMYYGYGLFRTNLSDEITHHNF